MGAQSSIVICGPAMRTNEAAVAKLRQIHSKVQILHVPPDFSTSDAEKAGPELLNRVRSLLAPPGD
jgi:hypothetical protein